MDQPAAVGAARSQQRVVIRATSDRRVQGYLRNKGEAGGMGGGMGGGGDGVRVQEYLRGGGDGVRGGDGVALALGLWPRLTAAGGPAAWPGSPIIRRGLRAAAVPSLGSLESLIVPLNP